MKQNRQEVLRAAFADGQAAAHDPYRGLSSRLRYKGKERDFFEAGYFKEEKKLQEEISAAEEAYLASPQYQEDMRKEREFLGHMVDAFKELVEYDLTSNPQHVKNANRHMNLAIGIQR